MTYPQNKAERERKKWYVPYIGYAVAIGVLLIVNSFHPIDLSAWISGACLGVFVRGLVDIGAYDL